MDQALVEALERESGPRFSGTREFEIPGFGISVLSETVSSGDRKEYLAVAVRR